MSDFVTSLNRTPIFEWHVVWCGSNIKYQQDMLLREIGLHIQNMVMTILSLSVNIIEEAL